MNKEVEHTLKLPMKKNLRIKIGSPKSSNFNISVKRLDSPISSGSEVELEQVEEVKPKLLRKVPLIMKVDRITKKNTYEEDFRQDSPKTRAMK